MIKKLKLALLALSATSLLNAQVPNFEWAKKIEGTGFHDDTFIDVDASGNVYITGDYNRTIDFDPGPGTFNLTPANSGSMFILKLDANGDFVWAKNILGSFYVAPLDLKLDNSSNIYITGNYNGTADFDPSAATYTLGATISQIFVLKLDGSGNFVWAKSMNGGIGGAGYSIDVDASGNVYTTGMFEGTTDFDPGVGTANLVSTGNWDVFISKLDVNGNYAWAKKMGGTGDDIGRSIAVDLSGNVYTTGQFTNTVDFNPGTGTLNLTSFGNDDGFISKLDVNGNYMWAKQLGGTSYDRPRSITIDGLGNVYTIGQILSSDADLDPSAATYTLIAGGYISKLNTNGAFVWAKRAPIAYYSGGITTDAANNVYVSGLFGNTWDFDPGVGTYTLTSVGDIDACVFKLDNNGDFLWAKQIGGTLEDFGSRIVVDASNNIFTTGSFNGTSNFNIGSSSYTLTATGANENRFIHKLGQCVAPNSPTNTTTAPLQICTGNTTTLTATSTGTISWYNNPTGGGNISTGTTFITSNTLTAGTYTYYAEASTCTVSASRTPITVTVNTTPTITVNSGTICSNESFTLVPSGASNYSYSSGSNVVTPTTSASYTVTGQSTEGCENTAVATVSVNPTLIPSISISTPSASICSNSAAFSSTITNGGTSPAYQWKKNGTNVGSGLVSYSPTSLQNGDVISCRLTSNATCASTTVVTSNSITITVNPTPTVSISSSNTLICVGQNASLNANGADTYLWNTTETATVITVNPTNNTTYTVTGTSTQGCSNSTTFTQNVSLCTSIEQLDKNAFSVYPNPSHGIFNITIAFNTAVTIVNILGEVIYSDNLQKGNHHINLVQQPSGIYFMQIEANGVKNQIRLLKIN